MHSLCLQAVAVAFVTLVLMLAVVVLGPHLLMPHAQTAAAHAQSLVQLAAVPAHAGS